jgi:hypothetical protein
VKNNTFKTIYMTEDQGWAQDITIDRVRAAFREDAQIIIFACHLGLTKEYLDKLSKLFGVKVRGFEKAVAYTLWSNSRGDRIIRRTYGTDIAGVLAIKLKITIGAEFWLLQSSTTLVPIP